MDRNCLTLKSPGTAEVEGLPKVGQTYYGIEFTRNTSNNGGTNGYHKMIGTEEMLKEMPVHNLLKVCAVKDAKIKQVLNQTNFFKDEDGNDVDLAGSNGEDFMRALTKPIYAIMGGTNETYDRYIVGLEPFSYGGDVAKRIEPFAESVDYSTQVDNKQRCIYDTNVAGSMGTQNTSIIEGFDVYKSSGGFPKTQTSRFNYELYARNKNEDNTKNYPYCNANTIDLSFLMTMMYIECRTKILTDVFGYGIETGSRATDDTWGTIAGAKVTRPDGSVEYYNLNENTAKKTYDETGTYHSIMQLLMGGSYPMLTVMEPMIDISNGCVNGEFDGVSCPDGTKIAGLEDGVMTGTWKKTMKGKANLIIEEGGEVEECDLEVFLPQPVYRGFIPHWGNLYYTLSGSEVLLHIDEDGNRENILFQAPDKASMTTDTDTDDKEDKEDWEFVGVYEELGDIGADNDWTTDVIRTKDGVTHPLGVGSGGSRTTYEGSRRQPDTSTETTGKYIRRGLWSGCCAAASASISALRYVVCGYAPSDSSAYHGGGFSVTLDLTA